jgi:flagellar hook-basal body complex protein FliE
MNVASTGAGVAGSIAKAAKAGAAGPAASFADSLTSLIDGVEQTQGEANTAVTGMLDKTSEVHDAMIALQRAEMSLQLTVQIRNKLVQAYQDVMRMPI